MSKNSTSPNFKWVLHPLFAWSETLYDLVIAWSWMVTKLVMLSWRQLLPICRKIRSVSMGTVVMEVFTVVMKMFTVVMEVFTVIYWRSPDIFMRTEQSETNIQNSHHQSRHVYHTVLLKATKSPWRCMNLSLGLLSLSLQVHEED